MCFDYDSRPFELPADLLRRSVSGGAAAELLTMTSVDGTEFSAALAESAESREPGVVIIPDVRGIYRSTSSSPSGSRRPATTRSPSTTTDGPQVSGLVTTSSTTGLIASR